MPRQRKSETARNLTVRVKKSRGRTNSSYRWLNRQLNDPYVLRARREGMRSRAAYKLEELNSRCRLFWPGCSVVDLGGAPGGWAQIAVAGTNSDGRSPSMPRGQVISVDLQEIEPLNGVDFLQLDLLSEESPEMILALSGGPVDIVASDMAAPSTGHSKTDHLRTMALCEAASDLADKLLRPGGGFVAKVLAGGTETNLLARLKRDFNKVRHVKPKASRAESSEKYVIASGYCGASLSRD